jgi:hypothetical protein
MLYYIMLYFAAMFTLLFIKTIALSQKCVYVLYLFVFLRNKVHIQKTLIYLHDNVLKGKLKYYTDMLFQTF